MGTTNQFSYASVVRRSQANRNLGALQIEAIPWTVENEGFNNVLQLVSPPPIVIAEESDSSGSRESEDSLEACLHVNSGPLELERLIPEDIHKKLKTDFERDPVSFREMLQRCLDTPYVDLRRRDYDMRTDYSPRVFLKEYEVYLYRGDSIKCADMLWAAFSNALSLFYQKMGINIMAHSAAKVLFTFAVLVLSEADLLEDYPAIADTYPAIADTYDRANTVHHYSYRSASWHELEVCAGLITNFVNASEFFDVELVEREFNSYIVPSSWKCNAKFTRKFGRLDILFEPHFDKIFGNQNNGKFVKYENEDSNLFPFDWRAY